MQEVICNPNNCLDCILDECVTSTKKCGTINGKKVKVIKQYSDNYKASDIYKYHYFKKRERE